MVPKANKTRSTQYTVTRSSSGIFFYSLSHPSPPTSNSSSTPRHIVLDKKCSTTVIPQTFKLFTKVLWNTIVYELVLEKGKLHLMPKSLNFLHFINCTFILKVIHILFMLYICVMCLLQGRTNLTTYWIWFFFNFNLCFLLLLFTKRILSLHNGLPKKPALCLNVKPKCLCSWKHSDLGPIGNSCKKKKLTHTQP